MPLGAGQRDHHEHTNHPGPSHHVEHHQSDKLPSYMKRRSQHGTRSSGKIDNTTASMSSLRVEMAKHLTGQADEVEEIDALEDMNRSKSPRTVSMHKKKSSLSILVDAKSLDRQLAAAGAGVHHGTVDRQHKPYVSRSAETSPEPHHHHASFHARRSRTPEPGDGRSHSSSWHGIVVRPARTASDGSSDSFRRTSSSSIRDVQGHTSHGSSISGRFSQRLSNGSDLNHSLGRHSAVFDHGSQIRRLRSTGTAGESRSQRMIRLPSSDSLEDFVDVSSVVSHREELTSHQLSPPSPSNSARDSSPETIETSNSAWMDSPGTVSVSNFVSLRPGSATGSSEEKLPDMNSGNRVNHTKSSEGLTHDVHSGIQTHSITCTRTSISLKSPPPRDDSTLTPSSTRSLPSRNENSSPAGRLAPLKGHWVSTPQPSKSPIMWSGLEGNSSPVDDTHGKRDEVSIDLKCEGVSTGNEVRISLGRIRPASSLSGSSVKHTGGNFHSLGNRSDLTINIETPGRNPPSGDNDTFGRSLSVPENYQSEGTYSPFRTLQHMKRSPVGSEDVDSRKDPSAFQVVTPPDTQSSTKVWGETEYSKETKDTEPHISSPQRSPDLSPVSTSDTSIQPKKRTSLKGVYSIERRHSSSTESDMSTTSRPPSLRGDPRRTSLKTDVSPETRSLPTPPVRTQKSPVASDGEHDTTTKKSQIQEAHTRTRRRSTVAAEVAVSSSGIMVGLQIDQTDKFRQKQQKAVEPVSKPKPVEVDRTTEKLSLSQEIRETLKTVEKEQQVVEESAFASIGSDGDNSKIKDPVTQIAHKKQMQNKTLVQHWMKVKEVLESGPINSVKELHDRILQYTEDSYLKGGVCLGIESLLVQEEEKGAFFSRILPSIISRSGQMLKEFSHGLIPKIKMGKKDKLVYTRTQVAAVLANMFLCSFPGAECSFGSLFMSRQAHQVAKLKFFVHYFDRLSSLPLDQPLGCIEVVQNVNTSQNCLLDRSQMPLLPARVHLEGHVHEQFDKLQTVAATPELFGALLSRGLGESEIRCLAAPEMAICLLVAKHMDDKSIIIVRGAEQFSQVEGEDFSLRWAGDLQDHSPKEKDGSFVTTIAFVDPKRPDRHDGNDVFSQLSAGSLNRELEKATSAFEILPDTSNFGSVAADFKAFGRMKGNLEVRALILWAATSNAGRELDLFVHKDIRFKRFFEDLRSILHEHNQTVGELLQAVTAASKLDLAPGFGGVFRGLLGCMDIEDLTEEQIDNIGNALSFESLRTPSTGQWIESETGSDSQDG